MDEERTLTGELRIVRREISEAKEVLPPRPFVTSRRMGAVVVGVLGGIVILLALLYIAVLIDGLFLH